MKKIGSKWSLNRFLQVLPPFSMSIPENPSGRVKCPFLWMMEFLYTCKTAFESIFVAVYTDCRFHSILSFIITKFIRFFCKQISIVHLCCPQVAFKYSICGFVLLWFVKRKRLYLKVMQKAKGVQSKDIKEQKSNS